MVSNLANAGVSVPNGFATTAYAFNQFLDFEGLDERIHQLLDELDVDDVDALRKPVPRFVNGFYKPPSQPSWKKRSVPITTN